jgi:hypothetical protein
MKVYGTPEHIKLTPDYSNYNRVEEQRKEDEYKAAIKQWLVSEGYTGPHTGEIIRFGVADGYAQYMFADGGRRSFLVHLDIGDAYQYRDVEYIPKAEILRRIERSKTSLFASRF